MLPLKYLVNDQDLVLTILSRWDYDADQLQLLERFRISSNAIYPFKSQGRLRFLRFAPLQEKTAPAVLAELDFLRYLRANDFPCLVSVPSKQGKQLETVLTSKGSFLATAFAGVPGRSLDPAQMTDQMIRGWGRTMGCLHRLSASYRPAGLRRQDHHQQLNWMKAVLDGLPGEEAARREVQIVSDWLADLPQDDDNYGLIHYDFETDNVFHDQKSGDFHVIDFDDAVYHWFMMDITTALFSYADDAPEGRFAAAMELFISGYRLEHDLTDAWVALMPGFRRYQNLYGYVRILHATRDPVDDQPQWMENLRRRLDALSRKRGTDFGKPI